MRRMFSLEVVNTDTFLDLPQSTQCLYFHLGMRADDDGFVASPRRIVKMLGTDMQDLQRLVNSGLLIMFPSGVCVLRHWHVNNQIRKDRYNMTRMVNELGQLTVDETGSYCLATKWQPDGNQMATQDRLGKDSSGKERVEEAPDGADALAVRPRDDLAGSG